MAAAIFPDNTVLVNFAAINRLDLLESWLRGRGRWTRAVADEARISCGYWPALSGLHDAGWLEEPIEIEGDEAVAAVERLRRQVFGGSASEPKKHLGESQTCYLIGSIDQWHGSWWISDDRDSIDFARHRGFVTLETIDIFRHVVTDGDLTIIQAYDLMVEMGDLRDGLRMPKTPTDLS